MKSFLTRISAANVVISLKGSLHLPNSISITQEKVKNNTNPASVSYLYIDCPI